MNFLLALIPAALGTAFLALFFRKSRIPRIPSFDEHLAEAKLRSLADDVARLDKTRVELEQVAKDLKEHAIREKEKQATVTAHPASQFAH